MFDVPISPTGQLSTETLAQLLNVKPLRIREIRDKLGITPIRVQGHRAVYLHGTDAIRIRDELKRLSGPTKRQQEAAQRKRAKEARQAVKERYERERIERMRNVVPVRIN